jgi:hypothetical protein
MKKIIQLALVSILLGGCSGLEPLLQAIATPTSPPPADTLTPAPTVTLIPTLDLFATLTPTPITFTPTRTPLVPDPPTDTPTPSFILPGSLPFTPQSSGFLSVLPSHYVVYYNTGPCTPRTLRITAYVQDIIHTDSVLIFMRPREKSDTMLLGDWSSGEMLKNENGSFYYDISAVNIRKYYWFRQAWIEYQLVSFDEDKIELARTPIYDRSISLIMCQSVSP